MCLSAVLTCQARISPPPSAVRVEFAYGTCQVGSAPSSTVKRFLASRVLECLWCDPYGVYVHAIARTEHVTTAVVYPTVLL